MPAVASEVPFPKVAALTVRQTVVREGIPPGMPVFQVVRRSGGTMSEPGAVVPGVVPGVSTVSPVPSPWQPTGERDRFTSSPRITTREATRTARFVNDMIDTFLPPEGTSGQFLS